MENLINVGLDELVGGGIVAAILSGTYAMIHILLNKKVRAPSDDEAARRAAIVERNEVVALYKKELDDTNERYGKQLEKANADIAKLQERVEKQSTQLEEQDKNIDLLMSEALATEHYIYRCIGTIYRLGSADDIPKPPPTRIRLTSSGDERHG